MVLIFDISKVLFCLKSIGIISYYFKIIMVVPLLLCEMFELFSDYLKSSPSYFPSFPILNFNEFSTSILAICPNIQNGRMQIYN